jgi:hypothetical protein
MSTRGIAALLAVGTLFLAETASAQTPGKVVTVFNRTSVPASTGIGTNTGGIDVDGYRYANVFVEWDQAAANEGPVALWVGFSLDAQGLQNAYRYRNLEEDNSVSPQDEKGMWVNGASSWGGTKSSYIGRLPIMGPRLTLYVYNLDANLKRIVSVRVYLTP